MLPDLAHFRVTQTAIEDPNSDTGSNEPREPKRGLSSWGCSSSYSPRIETARELESRRDPRGQTIPSRPAAPATRSPGWPGKGRSDTGASICPRKSPPAKRELNPKKRKENIIPHKMTSTQLLKRHIGATQNSPAPKVHPFLLANWDKGPQSQLVRCAQS